MADSIFTAIGALLIVLGLLMGLLFGARKLRMVPGAPANLRRTRELTIQETLPLTGNTRLVIVSWRGRDRLIAVGPQGVTSIAEEKSTLESQAVAVDDQATRNQ